MNGLINNNLKYSTKYKNALGYVDIKNNKTEISVHLC